MFYYTEGTSIHNMSFNVAQRKEMILGADEHARRFFLPRKDRQGAKINIGGFHKWGYPKMDGLVHGKSNL
jgi:hypothetical protein